jgi:molybdopterin molybdotransferase
MAIPLILVAGRSGAGKTTLLVKLIATLSQRGYRVASIKHHSHGGFEIDHTGKDSWRHAQAGSRHVVVAAPDKIASYRRLEQELSLEEIASSVSGVDIILVEGYKRAGFPTLEVVRAENSRDLVGRPEWRFAAATDVDLDVDVPQFSLDDVLGIADLIEARFLSGIGRKAGMDALPARPASRTGDASATVSFEDALARTVAEIAPLGAEPVDVVEACGRTAAQDLPALVDSPSLDVSLKDGYAIQSSDIAAASPHSPVYLHLVGMAAAGQGWAGILQTGAAVRVLTGAPIPRGAQAVVSAEFATDDGRTVTVVNNAAPGRNVLTRGSDVAHGQRIVTAGDLLRPPTAGLLAAAGHSTVPVYARPRVAILATGDEVVAPGHRLAPGKVFASNLVTLAAWCASYGLSVTTTIVRDNEDEIRAHLLACMEDHDALLTSGGAWKGERDLVVRVLDELGWRKVYHRVRMGPGKAVGLGSWQGRPVFCLPGGPPSNQMAFLQLALPGLHRLEGRGQPGLPVQTACLAETVRGQRDWTQFIHGRLELWEGTLRFVPMRMKSRLQEMAHAMAIMQIPEGVERIDAGAPVPVQTLDVTPLQPAKGWPQGAAPGREAAP